MKQEFEGLADKRAHVSYEGVRDAGTFEERIGYLTFGREHGVDADGGWASVFNGVEALRLPKIYGPEYRPTDLCVREVRAVEARAAEIRAG
jgi:hypothetical protein